MPGRADAPRCGRLLVEARRRHGLSQEDLAQRTGMPQTNISRIERDKVSPSLATFNRLLEAMGETMRVTSVSLDAPPPGGGNASIRELRSEFDGLTPDQRLEQSALLCRAVSELDASRERRG